MPSKSVAQAIAIRAAYGRAKKEGKDTSKLREWVMHDKSKFGTKALRTALTRAAKGGDHGRD